MICMNQKFTSVRILHESKAYTSLESACTNDLPKKRAAELLDKTRQPLSDLIYRLLQNLLKRSGLCGCFRSRTLIILHCPLCFTVGNARNPKSQIMIILHCPL